MALNLSLFDNPSKENVPEEYDGMIDCSSLAVCCSFNRRGSLLAVGCNDGRVVIWDFLTRIVAKSIPAHTNHPVSSISWSRNGHKLVTASLDNTVAVWEVLSGECLIRWRCPSPILKTQLNPRNDNLVLVCPHKSPSLILEINYDQRTMQHKILPSDRDDSDPNNIASFDRRGQYVYTGNVKGRLVIIKCPKSFQDCGDAEPEIVSSFRIFAGGSTPAAIREIEFGARNKTHFLVNSSDRAIRLYSCDSALKAGINGSCDEVRKFQDIVNKTMWKRCCFSGDAEASHVCGGSARQHQLYIWETENGTIKKMLQGTKGEMLLDVQWHPLRPVLASISSGYVSFWARAEIENWSAYAPDFKELEENEEYDERESEFDVEDEDKRLEPEKKDEDDDDSEIDVEGIEKNDYLVSSDEENVDVTSLVYIPISLEEYEMVADPQHHTQ